MNGSGATVYCEEEKRMRLVFLEKVDGRVGIQSTWKEKFKRLFAWMNGWAKR